MAAPKLSRNYRDTIIERIIAGDTNSQIRKELEKVGFKGSLVDSAFTPYRSLPEVLEAITRKEEQAIQSGLAQKSERILKLAQLAKALELELFAEDGRRLRDMEKLDKVRLGREYRAALADIGGLVDPRKAITLQHVDMEGLSDEQIEQLRRGVPIEVILATASAGRVGAQEAQGQE
jgi:hypothetical protein